jgi:hypothetical protein
MNINVRHERMTEDGCRNADKSAANGGYAGIYNDEGYGIANIDRLARIDGDGDLGFVHDHIECNDEPRAHATTDEQWKSMIRLLDAAPALLAMLKDILSDLDCGEGLSLAEADAMRSRIIEAIAKAEPPRVIRRRVRVAVEVCVDVDVDATDEAAQRLAVGLVRDGEGQVVSHDLVS